MHRCAARVVSAWHGERLAQLGHASPADADALATHGLRTVVLDHLYAHAPTPPCATRARIRTRAIHLRLRRSPRCANASPPRLPAAPCRSTRPRCATGAAARAARLGRRRRALGARFRSGVRRRVSSRADLARKFRAQAARRMARASRRHAQRSAAPAHSAAAPDRRHGDRRRRVSRPPRRHPARSLRRRDHRLVADRPQPRCARDAAADIRR